MSETESEHINNTSTNTDISYMREAFEDMGPANFLYLSGEQSFTRLEGLPAQITQITQVTPALLPFSITLYTQALEQAWDIIPPSVVRSAISNYHTAIANCLQSIKLDHGDMPEQIANFDELTRRIAAQIQLRSIDPEESLEKIQQQIDTISQKHPEWAPFLQDEISHRMGLIAQKRRRWVYSGALAIAGICVVLFMFITTHYTSRPEYNPSETIEPTPGQYSLNTREVLWCKQQKTDIHAAATNMRELYPKDIPVGIIEAYKNSINDYAERCDRAYISNSIKQYTNTITITPSTMNVQQLVHAWNAQNQGTTTP